MTEMEKWLARYAQKSDFWDDGYHLNYELRCECIATFSFAILTQEMIEGLKKYVPILEIGCGTGYWAYELKINNVDIIATDPNPYLFTVLSPIKLWIEIEKLTAEKAIELYPNRTLLICWPSIDENWAAQALEVFVGDTIIYVGEFRGCTANCKFFDLLEENWEVIEEITMPRWECMTDRCIVYRRS